MLDSYEPFLKKNWRFIERSGLLSLWLLNSTLSHFDGCALSGPSHPRVTLSPLFHFVAPRPLHKLFAWNYYYRNPWISHFVQLSHFLALKWRKLKFSMNLNILGVPESSRGLELRVESANISSNCRNEVWFTHSNNICIVLWNANCGAVDIIESNQKYY